MDANLLSKYQLAEMMRITQEEQETEEMNEEAKSLAVKLSAYNKLLTDERTLHDEIIMTVAKIRKTCTHQKAVTRGGMQLIQVNCPTCGLNEEY